MSLKLLLQKFLDRVEKVLSSEDDPLGSEFLALRDLSRQLTQNEEYAALVGALEENNRKNRYKDIRPFDCTRVSLLPFEGLPGSDYINANFIQGPTGRTSYIASQGPLPHTVDDFWAMLWQYKIEVVVMACNEREAGKAKCERYWPYNGEEKWFRNINIKLVREDLICEDFVVRHLLASDGTTERPIQQFHYVNWPDHGAPETCTSLLDMIAMIRVAQPGDSHPIVVHCSAGCGRTGTICAVDYAWNVLKNGTLTEEFNVFNIIVEMRKQRTSCVQTKDQYILVHQAIAELFEQHLSMIKDHLYENVVVEGAGREVIEDIYEDVRGMNLGDKKEDVNEDIYVNADSLPKKRLSSHAAEKIIMETIANMVTDEDDETPDKFYAVSRSLSKMNAGIQPGTKKVTEDKGRNWGQGPPALPAKKTSPAPDQDGRKSDPTSNATQEKQGPPALPVKKTNLLPEQDGRKSDPTTKQEKLPVQRKFSLGSLKRKQKSVIGDSSRSPDLPPKKGSAEKGRSQSTLEKDESGKTEKNLLNFGEQMMKGKVKKGKNGADVSYQGDDVEDHLHVANVNELRQKLEHTGIPVAGVMAHPVAKKRASSIDKVCVEKTTDKSHKSSLPHEKTAVKPEAAAKSNRIKGWKKTNSGEKTGKMDAPKALPRHRVGSDASQGSPNEERKKVPLPLPKPRELVSNADKTEFQRQMSESSDYSEPYEMVKSVGAQLSHSTLHQSESTGTGTYKLEESVAANDSSYSYVDVAGTAGQNRETPSLPSEKPADFQCIAHKDQSTQGSVIRRTKLLPDWLDDENPYETLGGKTEVPSSVGADETTDKQDNPDLDSLYSEVKTKVTANSDHPNHGLSCQLHIGSGVPPLESINLPSSFGTCQDPPLSKPVPFTTSSIDPVSNNKPHCTLSQSNVSATIPIIPDTSSSTTFIVDDDDYEYIAFENESSSCDLPPKADSQTALKSPGRSTSESIPPSLPVRNQTDAPRGTHYFRSISSSLLNGLLGAMISSTEGSPKTSRRKLSAPFLASPKNQRRNTSTPDSTFYRSPSDSQTFHPVNKPGSSPQVVSYKSSSSSQPANGATSWSSRDSLDDERPPVPVKLYDVTPVTETGKVNESTVKDSHGGKFKFSFSNLKNKFQVGSSKSADISSLDNMKGDEPRHPPIPFILAFPNRTDKPKGGRPPPWAK